MSKHYTIYTIMAVAWSHRTNCCMRPAAIALHQGWVQLRNWLRKIDVIVIESGSPYVAVIVIEYLLYNWVKLQSITFNYNVDLY